MRTNNAQGKLNYSQRNNEFYMEKIGPKGKSVMKNIYMCNVTSMCMAAIYNGFKEEDLPKGKYEQPEDNFCDFLCNNEEVINYYKINFPAMYNDWISGKSDAYWPNEVHLVLSKAFNLWVKQNVAEFKSALSLKEFIKNLYNGITMPVSMTFGKLGHIICVQDFETSDTEETVKEYLNSNSNTLPKNMNIIFDDPFGRCTNFDTGSYTTESGNNRIMSIDQFIKYSKPLNEKSVMCHIIKK